MLVDSCKTEYMLRRADSLGISVVRGKRDYAHISVEFFGDSQKIALLKSELESMQCTPEHKAFLEQNAKWYTERGW